MEVVLQRYQDVGERYKLLWRQPIGEVPLDRSHVWHGGPPERAPAFGGQRNLGSAAVDGAVIPPDQPPPLQPAKVM